MARLVFPLRVGLTEMAPPDPWVRWSGHTNVNAALNDLVQSGWPGSPYLMGF